MHRNKLMVAVLVVCTLCLAGEAQAIIVHHCDYTPEILTPGVHNRDEADSSRDCGNEYASGVNLPGHCDHENQYYWTDIDCFDTGGYFTANSCQMSGKVDCPGGDRSYNMTCSGTSDAGVFAQAGRTQANCGGQQSCSCDSPTTSYCYVSGQ